MKLSKKILFVFSVGSLIEVMSGGVKPRSTPAFQGIIASTVMTPRWDRVALWGEAAAAEW